MVLLNSLLLGVLQGLTEFLPVSSSGHLVLAQSFMPGFGEGEILLDVMLHGGTLLAVLVYFHREVLRLLRALLPGGSHEGRRLAAMIIAGSVPTGLIGYFGRDFLRPLFDSPVVAASMLLVTGALLWVGELFGRGRDDEDYIGVGRALAIGVVQGLAIIPGISRSGSTIAVSRLLGIDGEAAARFSFLLSVPAVVGAVALEAGEATSVGLDVLAGYVGGVFAAFLSGLWAIKFLMGAIRRGRFKWFGVYCWVVGGTYLVFA